MAGVSFVVVRLGLNFYNKAHSQKVYQNCYNVVNFRRGNIWKLYYTNLVEKHSLSLNKKFKSSSLRVIRVE